MTPKRQFELKLGYAFAPIPKWIVAEWCAGRISREAFALHVVLYEKAISRKLMQRLPTPRMLRTELAKDLRRPDDAAFAKLVQRERNRGRLDYVVEGNAVTGYVYLFTLFPDGPKLSDFGPTSSGEAGPTSNGNGDGDTSGMAARGGEELSGHVGEQESPTGPTDGGPCPTSNDAANALPESDPGDAEEETGPTFQDVRETPNLRRGADLLGRASGDHAHDVSQETEHASNGRTKTAGGLTIPLFEMAKPKPESAS